MKLLLAIIIAAAASTATAAKHSVRSDFMEAMNEATKANSMQALQRKLIANAVPRMVVETTRLLADNAANYPLNLTDYAMKYVGCQNIKSFSDDLAEDQDSSTVLGINKFVVFRLCEASKCSTYNKYGCQDNFGEYIIEMEYYLKIMSEYHYQTYLTYCETCIACMTPPEGMDDDTIYAAYNNTGDDDAYTMATNNITANYSNYSAYAWSAETDCQYYSACHNYGKACKDYNSANKGDDDNVNAQMLVCQQVSIGNTVGYLGPHCADDGISLTTAFFRNEDCTELMGSKKELSYYTGMTLDDSWMKFYYNPSCVSCANEVSIYVLIVMHYALHANTFCPWYSIGSSAPCGFQIHLCRFVSHTLLFVHRNRMACTMEMMMLPVVFMKCVKSYMKRVPSATDTWMFQMWMPPTG
jgi:hypothetical protein